MALCVPLFGATARADDATNRVLERLEKLEKENAKLKAKVSNLEGSKISGPTYDARGGKAIVSTAPNPTMLNPSEPLDDGWYFRKKTGKNLTFQTPGGEITPYGQFDLSVDGMSKGLSGFVNRNPLSANNGAGDSPIGDMGWQPQISSNISYIGVRGFQNMMEYEGKPVRFVYQIETLIDFSANPGARESNSQQSNVVAGALAARNSWIGVSQADYGALKIGKSDAPYKIVTADFNPFNGQIGTYTAIMGNTGGDNRVEFETRLEHAIWYESPSWQGFQFSALISPGQNRSDVNDNIASGSPDCTGGNIPGSGNPVGNVIGQPQVGPVACTDGSFGDAYSISGTYINGGLTIVGGYERHSKVNRSSDIYGESPGADIAGGVNAANRAYIATLDVADEDAWKVGVQYRFPTKTVVSAIYENMHRYVPQSLQFQNERQREGTWLAVSQDLTEKDNVAFGWAHAFATPGDIGQHNSAGGFNPANAADMFTGAYKHKISPGLTWYINSAATLNQGDAHYDLGAGTHGVTTDCHDASNASGDPTYSSPHCWTGGTLIGVSTGFNYKF